MTGKESDRQQHVHRCNRLDAVSVILVIGCFVPLALAMFSVVFYAGVQGAPLSRVIGEQYSGVFEPWQIVVASVVSAVPIFLPKKFE